MKKLLNPLITLLIGVVFALILNIPMNFFEKYLFGKKERRMPRLKRFFSIFLSLLLIFGLFLGIAFWVIPSIAAAVADIRLPKELLQNFFAIDRVKEQLSVMVSSAAELCVRFFISLVFAVYLLANRETLLFQLLRLVYVWIPERTGCRILHAIAVILGTFRRFIVGQTLEACILGSLCGLGMLLLRLPYAFTVGTLVGVTALFPVIGAYVGAAAGVSLIYPKNQLQALIFLIFLIILQQLENNLIYPKVVGSKLKLPAIWVMASITIGGSIGGPVGIFLAVPSAASAYALLKEATQIRQNRSGV